jgi:hypothetical protein
MISNYMRSHRKKVARKSRQLNVPKKRGSIITLLENRKKGTQRYIILNSSKTICMLNFIEIIVARVLLITMLLQLNKIVLTLIGIIGLLKESRKRKILPKALANG